MASAIRGQSPSTAKIGVSIYLHWRFQSAKPPRTLLVPCSRLPLKIDNDLRMRFLQIASNTEAAKCKTLGVGMVQWTLV